MADINFIYGMTYDNAQAARLRYQARYRLATLFETVTFIRITRIPGSPEELEQLRLKNLC